MQAIAALHAQLSAATEQLDFAQARLEFLRQDNKLAEEKVSEETNELNRLTELLAATADDEAKDAQLLAEQESETAALEARFHLCQLQLEAVPSAFQKLATKFVDVSQRYTLEIDAMMSMASEKDFWRDEIATTTRDIGLLRRQHKDTVARQQIARQHEEMALKQEAEEEENSLSMIEACLTVYEKKLQLMPRESPPMQSSSSSSSAAASGMPGYSRTTPTSIYQTAVKPSETTYPHHPSRPTKNTRPYEDRLGHPNTSHPPHNGGSGQTMSPDSSFPPTGSNGGLPPTTHTTLVTHRVIEEVEVVDTPLGRSSYPPAPSFQHHHHRYHDSCNDNHVTTQQSHHQQQQHQQQQHPYPHGESYEVAERPWYQGTLTHLHPLHLLIPHNNTPSLTPSKLDYL